MIKSELHRLWDDHVNAASALYVMTQKGADPEPLERLRERVAKTRAAYEAFLRTGKVTR